MQIQSMSTIQVHDKQFVPYLTAEKIQQRILELSQQISTDYAHTKPLFIAILNGSFMFAVDLRNQPESAAADAVFTGRNMSNSDVVLNFTIGSANGTNVYTWWAHNRLMSVDALDGTTELIQ